MQQYQQFKQQMSGKDPQALLDMLLQSGRVSQADIDRARQLAEMYRGLFNQPK